VCEAEKYLYQEKRERLIMEIEPPLTDDEKEFVHTQVCCNCEVVFHEQPIEFVRLISGGIVYWCKSHPSK